MKKLYASSFGLVCPTIVFAESVTVVSKADVVSIERILKKACVDMENGKIDGTTWYFEPDIIVYDLVAPLVSDAKTVKEGNRHWHEIIDGRLNCKYEEIQVHMLGATHAFSGSIIYLRAKLKTGFKLAIRMRSTDVWEKTNDGWRAIHEHTSVPLDGDGKALLTLPLHAIQH